MSYKTADLIKILGCTITAEPKDIPTCFKTWRLIRGKTIRQVEADTGISNPYLSQLESGKAKKPSFEVVVKLCRYYDVNLTIAKS